MAECRIPGPLGSYHRTPDDGTTMRRLSMPPGPVGCMTQPVESMPRFSPMVGTPELVGMPASHFQAVRQVAMDPKNHSVILFRQTNPRSIPFIERGFPAKPGEIKMAKTSDVTGIVTCRSVEEVMEARNAEYYIVDADRLTAKNAGGQVIDVRGRGWPVEPGQVIDAVSKKPLVGDYDLFDVFDWGVLDGRQPGNHGNLVLATSEGKLAKDFTNPRGRQIKDALNAAFGSPRVMHGHHGAYDSIENLKSGELVTAFLPDGTVVSMEKAGLHEFYQRIDRSTLDLIKWRD